MKHHKTRRKRGGGAGSRTLRPVSAQAHENSGNVGVITDEDAARERLPVSSSDALSTRDAQGNAHLAPTVVRPAPGHEGEGSLVAALYVQRNGCYFGLDAKGWKHEPGAFPARKKEKTA